MGFIIKRKIDKKKKITIKKKKKKKKNVTTLTIRTTLQFPIFDKLQRSFLIYKQIFMK